MRLCRSMALQVSLNFFLMSQRGRPQLARILAWVPSLLSMASKSTLDMLGS